jgi:hypothetical protein
MFISYKVSPKNIYILRCVKCKLSFLFVLVYSLPEYGAPHSHGGGSPQYGLFIVPGHAHAEPGMRIEEEEEEEEKRGTEDNNKQWCWLLARWTVTI